MKFLALALLALTTTQANAAIPELNASRVADLLANPKVAACLTKLQKLQEKFELSASSEGMESVENGETVTTTIPYTAIQGGDMAVGEVELVITEKNYSSAWGPETSGLVIESCKVNVNIRGL